MPVDRRGLQLLRRYITHSRKATIQNVFVYNNKPITAESLNKLIRRLGERAGLSRTIGPHIFRHAFATNYIDNGGDAFSLKRILRHTTMYTSLRYVHSSAESIRGKMEESSVMRGVEI